jgi:acetyl esterase/lipase
MLRSLLSWATEFLGVWRAVSVVPTLVWTLLRILGFHVYWMKQLLRMLLLILCIIPGMVPCLIRLLLSRQVKKNIRYGPAPRNHMDIYCPTSKPPEKGYPVVIFICGGGWIIGYKAWSVLQGLCCMLNGILFISMDYRNFPQGKIVHMLEDLNSAILYTFSNASFYGGDPSRVFLVGQSAGAHLASYLLLQQVHLEAQGKDLKWKASDLRGLIGISGPYNLVAASRQFHRKGLHKSVQAAIFGGLDRLVDFSPSCLASRLATKSFVPSQQLASVKAMHSGELPDVHPLLFSNSPSPLQRQENHGPMSCTACQEMVPTLHAITCATKTSSQQAKCCPITLIHGTSDRSIHHESSLEFANILHMAGFRTTLKLYPGKSHTDLILEDPLCGSDTLSNDLSLIVSGRPIDGLAVTSTLDVLPRALMHLARLFNPF